MTQIPKLYLYAPKTRELIGQRDATPRPGGKGYVLQGTFATPVAPPDDIPDGYAARWTGKSWELVEDHRQKTDAQGRKYGGTAYWLPGDTWQSPERYIEELGPLPGGAVTTRPEKPAPSLSEAKANAVAMIDRSTSAAITAGFDYEMDPGTGTAETLHFSYDSFDQQNFADTANVATLALSGVKGLPTSVTWNAYRNYTIDTGGELVRLTLEPSSFLELYTSGALSHKAMQMEIGGVRKEAIEAAENVEIVAALLSEWGL